MDAAKREPISVLVADGDLLVCRALARLLGNSADVEVVATALDEAEVLERAGQFRPAVAIVDARTTQMDGMDVTRRLSRRFPATRVVVLGVYSTMREEALSSGACRFLLKDSSGDELVEAIRLAANGECQANETDNPTNPTGANALCRAYRHRTER